MRRPIIHQACHIRFSQRQLRALDGFAPRLWDSGDASNSLRTLGGGGGRRRRSLLGVGLKQPIAYEVTPKKDRDTLVLLLSALRTAR